MSACNITGNGDPASGPNLWTMKVASALVTCGETEDESQSTTGEEMEPSPIHIPGVRTCPEGASPYDTSDAVACAGLAPVTGCLVEVFDTDFSNNHAIQAGGLDMTCQAKPCGLVLRNTHFRGNTMWHESYFQQVCTVLLLRPRFWFASIRHPSCCFGMHKPYRMHTFQLILGPFLGVLYLTRPTLASCVSTGHCGHD